MDSLVLFMEISELCRIDEFSCVGIDSMKEVLAFISGRIPVLRLPDSVELMIPNSSALVGSFMLELFDATFISIIPVVFEALVVR